MTIKHRILHPHSGETFSPVIEHLKYVIPSSAAIFGVLFVAWYLFWEDVIAPPTLALQYAAVARCDLNNGACRTNLSTGPGATVIVEPRPFAPMRVTRVRVMVEGISADKVELDFRGVEMEMGRNRFPMVFEDGVWVANVMLPVCVRDAMLWELRVLTYTPNGDYGFPFRFETRKP